MTDISAGGRSAALRPRLSVRHMPAGWGLSILAVLVVAAAIISLGVGAVPLSIATVVHAIWDPAGADLQARTVVHNIRLPRTILAVLIGGSLGAGGALMQGLFRNPLADPGFAGVSSGAMLGAVSVIVLGHGTLPFLPQLPATFALPVTAFLGSLGATWCLYLMATRRGRTSVATMLLGGVALAAFASAISGLLIFSSDDWQLRDFIFWNLGSLNGASWEKVAVIILPIAVALALSFRLGRSLNVLALGEASAFYAGIKPQPLKRQCIVLVALLTGCAVAVSGLIGFVGIIVPHLFRLLRGADHRFLLPASALGGAFLFLCADMVARLAVAPAELPVGIVTAAIGAPFFLWLLLSKRHFVDM